MNKTLNSQHHQIVLGIVIPCFNDELTLPNTIIKINHYLESLIQKDASISAQSFALFVNDGSQDQTWSIIEKACAQYATFNGLYLSRNVGHQNALLSGLLSARHHCSMAVSIDSDLQDDLSSIDQMIDAYKKGFEIVYGVRKNRDTDHWLKRSTAILFYKLMRVLGTQIVFNHADFRLMGKKALEALSQYPEVNIFLRGIVTNLGFQTTCVYYDRLERKFGSSKYSFYKLIKLAWEGITSFSIRPLQWITLIGVLCFCLSIVGALIAVYGKLVIHTVIPGWTSTVLLTYFMGGIQLLSIGLIGEYIGKIYQEVKHRPKYFIERTIGKTFSSSNTSDH